MIDEKKLLNEMIDLLAKDCKDMELCGKIVGLISVQPTVHPQGIDKNRLIEFLKGEYDGWKTLAYEQAEQFKEAGYGAMSAIGSILEWIDQQPQTGWIPCSVAVPANADPDERDDILIKRVTGEIIRGWYWSGSGRWWTKENGIGHEVRNAIAWMPYKESEQE